MLALAITTTSCGGGRNIRTAQDITPGNVVEKQLDWKYGANDIRIQTTKLTNVLMERWLRKTSYDIQSNGRPKIIISQIDNRTDEYIDPHMIRDIFEGVAVNDGRFTIVVGDDKHEKEMDSMLSKFENHPKYAYSAKPKIGNATAPQFLAKVKITKASTMQKKFDIVDYRMQIELYDIETQEIIDSAWDVLRKQVSL
ncbi:MAG: putative secreted protein [Chlamydiales bacterium]|nr:putative secreted protein [Chlamydiales bacterium]